MSCTDTILETLTPIEFKNLFYRGFVYADNWEVGITYNIPDQVFYEANKKFYQAIQNGVIGGLPTDSNNWKQIAGTNLVADQDITNAYAEACLNFNPALFSGDDEMIMAYLYLSAHYLVFDINAGGLSSQGGAGILSSRSVANVAESYTIPEWQQKEVPSFYLKTSYGQKYWSLIAPKLKGAFVTVCGATTP